MTIIKPARIHSLDVAKGIAITLVVAAHCERGLINSGLLAPTPLVRALDGFVYAWHVPLFFVVAGILAPRAMEAGARAFVTARVSRLAWPYALWAPLQYVAQAVAPSNHPPPLGDVWTVVYDPPAQFWFVYALFMQSLLFAALWPRVGRAGWLVLGAVSYLAVHVYGLPLGPWGVPYAALDHLVYFGLGVWLSDPEKLRDNVLINRSGALIYIVVGFGMLTAVGITRGIEQNAVTGMLGIMGAFGLATLLAGTRAAPVLSLLGRRSLEIYVAHTLASAGTRVVLGKLLGVQDAGAHFAIGTLAGIAGPLALVAVSERMGWAWLWRWPERRVTVEREERMAA